MKKGTIFILGIVILCGAIIYGSNQKNEEKEAIKEIIQYSLIDGYLNEYDIDKMLKGIHPEFTIMEFQKGELSKRKFEDLLAYARRVKPQRPNGRRVKVTIKILTVDVVGDIGCAKVEFYVRSTLHGTDYISLMKFKNDWKLMTSIAHEHK